jgi:hypothetical protein
MQELPISRVSRKFQNERAVVTIRSVALIYADAASPRFFHTRSVGAA